MSLPTMTEGHEAPTGTGISPGLQGKKPKRRWWVWLLALAVLGYGVYRMRRGTAGQPTTAGAAQTAKLEGMACPSSQPGYARATSECSLQGSAR